MRKITLGFILIWTAGFFLGEFINEFSNSKTLYVLLNTKAFFKKDTLVNIESAISAYGRQARPNIWVYKGKLLYARQKEITMNISEEAYDSITPDTLMVWYCEFANLIVRRDTEVMSHNPFIQHRFVRSILLPWITFFLFVPNLFWYLALSIPHRKKLFYGIIVGYFLLFIYGCITDFEFIKSHMVYFQNQPK